MPLLTPPPAAPQRGDRTTFANRVDAFITWLINFVTELVALVSNLNSIAAGGAYAIPYRLVANTLSNGSAAGGVLALDGPANTFTQGSATGLIVDHKSATGAAVAALLDTFMASTSTVKGHFRVQKLGDPNQWATFAILSVATYANYRYFTVSPVGSSSAWPFADGDAVVLQFQRNGDKGDKGDKGESAVTQVMRVRDERPANTSGDGAVTSTWATRTLNTVGSNSISGASLSANLITLPAGTYRYAGSANATLTGAHQAQLYSVTDGAPIDYGTTEFAATGLNVYSRSILRGQFTLYSSKQIALRHWTSAAGNFGTAASNGNTQVYAELFFEKVA